MSFANHCKKCKSSVHCCMFRHGGFVFVTINDIKAIKKFTKKELAYFVDNSKLPKALVEALKHDDPSLEGALRYSQIKNGSIRRLKTKKDGRCIFLNDCGKCDIYKIRPDVCRIFPYWAVKLTSGQIKVISHDPCPKCSIIRGQKDVEKHMTKKQIVEIKRIFKNIKKSR